MENHKSVSSLPMAAKHSIPYGILMVLEVQITIFMKITLFMILLKMMKIEKFEEFH